MAQYITVKISTEISDRIDEVVDDKTYLYRTKMEFINEVLRDKLTTLLRLQLKKREVKAMEENNE